MRLRGVPWKVVAMVACGAALFGLTSCSPYQYEVIPLTAEQAVSHLEAGDHIRIHTLSGDVIDDVFEQISEGEIQCSRSTTDLSSMAMVERRTLNAANAIGGTLVALLCAYAITLGIGVLTWGH